MFKDVRPGEGRRKRTWNKERGKNDKVWRGMEEMNDVRSSSTKRGGGLGVGEGVEYWLTVYVYAIHALSTSDLTMPRLFHAPFIYNLSLALFHSYHKNHPF
jgi:hypothetical protein